MKLLPAKGLYAITDCENLTTELLINKTEQILRSGAVMLQYRNKYDDFAIRESQARELKILCDKYYVPFIINDDFELASAINADGVHLGKEDHSCEQARDSFGQQMIIGISCYNDIGRAMAAENTGASYIAFGAFFPTNTKHNTVKAGPELIQKAKQRLKLPVVAIGGITPENGKLLIDAGADFLAVVGGIYGPADPAQVMQSYITLFNN
ncbi:MAG: thiamine-phosphate diphosphorylase [Gammaproteobacteria bacterium RIFCSPLOWO2_02_47_7]|nr:MAG: thiamine-phosphate diphosphorylase [Gammaproteobacteria bacterium RIFCSPLOWO2_02_47_7]OGT75734.1 MAG: thiamine-phosphate diphosphorylase [Gammaproteobacteria bacterium RIFCSPLOWO2_12_47_11]